MAFRTSVSTQRKNKLKDITRVLGLSLVVFLMVIAGSTACKKSEEAASEEGVLEAKEGIIEFEGIVKAGIGRYLFVPEVSGFDIVILGQVESGDASTLIDKEIRGKGEFSPDKPSILVALTIDVKEAEDSWRNVFTKTEEFVVDDYIDLKTRKEFQVLRDVSYDEKESWEGVERVKLFGKLEKETVTEGEELKDIYRVIILDEKDNEVAKIIADNFTDYAQYYVEKLKLFDKLWFYINIKETVDWRVRRRTREIFNADVLFCGLF